MTDAYAAAQRKWLGRLYPGLEPPGNTEAKLPLLDPDSSQWLLVQIFQNFLERKHDAAFTTRRLAKLISSHHDPETLHSNMWGCFFAAVETFSSQETLTSLSNFVYELAMLPGAITGEQEPLADDTPGSTTSQVEEEIATSEAGTRGPFWKDLHDFNMNLRERFNGPEAYLGRHRIPEVPDTNENRERARTIWTNINTFIAVLARDHGKHHPSFANFMYAFWTLSPALENGPKPELGKNLPLHVPAACRWIMLAGDPVVEELERAWEAGKPFRAPLGDMWRSRDGRWDVTPDRWMFWRERFEIVAGDDRLDDTAKEEALQAAARMKSLVPSELFERS